MTEFYRLDLIPAGSAKSRFCQFEFFGEPSYRDFNLCSHCGAKLGPRDIGPPQRISLKGSEFGDLSYCGHGRQFLISRRFLDVWNSRAFKGLEDRTEVITAGVDERLKSQTYPGYSLVRPPDKLTLLQPSESGLVVKKLVGCDRCGVARRSDLARIRVDEKTWDGTDIFYPTGLYGILLVTLRVAEMIMHGEFLNFFLIHEDSYNEHR